MATTRVNALQLGVAGFVMVISIILAVGASRFPVDKGYTILGPHVYPMAVAAFLAVIALGLAWQAVSGGFRGLGSDSSEPRTPGGAAGAAWVSAGLVAVAVLINHIGFVLAAALLFVLAARGFGSKRLARDMAVGIALTLPVFWIFTQGLGVSLPSLVNGWI